MTISRSDHVVSDQAVSESASRSVGVLAPLSRHRFASSRRLPGALVALVVGVSTFAGTSDAATPDYTKLPSNSLYKVASMKERPERLSPRSRAAGLFPARKIYKSNYGLNGSAGLGVFFGAAASKAFKADGARNFDRSAIVDETAPEADTRCIGVARSWALVTPRETVWEQISNWQFSIQDSTVVPMSRAARQNKEQMTVRLIATERLFVDGDAATLRGADGWLDPLSLGMKYRGAYEEKFVRVATGPGDVQVFAGKNEVEKRVQFVVYQPQREAKLEQVMNNNLWVRANGHSASSSCGHGRVSIATAAGTGEHVAVQVEVVVADKKVARVERTFDGAKETKQVREVSIRSMAIHLGVSQGAKDKVPRPTVSFSWRGRARQRQIR